MEALPSGLATDSSGRIYVGALSQTGPEVLVYPAGSSGTASPTRTILGDNGLGSTASFIDIRAMAVDSSDQLYVLDLSGGVYVFASTANGAAIPIRHIQGSLTQLATPEIETAISVDAADNTYVSLAPTTNHVSTWTILVFSATQNGNVAPARVITATNPTPLLDPFAYALDANGNLYMVDVGTEGEAITEFASNGSSTATPVKTISGSATGLGLGAVLALRVDAAGNIFTLSAGISGLSVDAFGASGSGNLAPAVQFTSTSLTQAGPLTQLAVN
ncbi:MAG: NHL repeat-containing protein [Acidobacteriaceae bacterium]